MITIVIPRQHYVILFKHAKYVAKDADVDGAEQGVIIAPRADQIIPKSIAHSSVIADIVTRKFVDGLPLYRQEKIYTRDGVELNHQPTHGLATQLDAIHMEQPRAFTDCVVEFLLQNQQTVQ